MKRIEVRFFSLFLLLCLMIFLTMSVFAQQKMVEEMVIRGYRSVTKEEILRHIKTKIGDPFDEKQIRQDFQKVLELGIFDQLRSSLTVKDGERQGKVVIFNLKEKVK